LTGRRSPFLPLFILLFALSAFRVESNTPPASALSGTVTWVYDGDTLHVEPHGKVRLICIDSPEHKTSPERDRKFLRLGADPRGLRFAARQALAFNIREAKGEKVLLLLEGERRDRYGRLLAYLELPDGRLLNHLLLEQGLAVVYRRFEFSMKEDFLAVEAAARKSGRGLWSGLSKTGSGAGNN